VAAGRKRRGCKESLKERKRKGYKRVLRPKRKCAEVMGSDVLSFF